MTEERKKSPLFNHKILKLIMTAFGSFLIAVGPFYAYFIFTTVGWEGLGEVIWTFVTAVLAFPAGLVICLIGRKIKGPIIEDE